MFLPILKEEFKESWKSPIIKLVASSNMANKKNKSNPKFFLLSSQLAFTYSQSTVETPEQYVKSIQIW